MSPLAQVPAEVITAAQGWVRRVACQVRPIWVLVLVEHLMRQALASRGHQLCQGATRHRWLLFVANVSRAMGTFGAASLPAEAFVATEVPVEALGAPRSSRVRSKSAQRAAGFQAGKLAVLHPGSQQAPRRLVEAQQVVWRIDTAAVAAALDTHTWFAIGGEGGHTAAWHACRVHHRCRLLFAPDSPCERMGSLLRLLWDQRSSSAYPSYSTDRLLLAQAGVQCAGGARGEMIIEEVAALWRKMSKRMVARAGVATAQVTDRHASLQASGRAQGSLPLGDREALAPEAVGDLDGAGGRKRRAFFQDRARESKPVTLPQLLEATVQAACPAGGLIRALPVDVGHLHAQERGAAVSSLRERMRNWTDTEQGQTWLTERAALFQADDDEPAGPEGVTPVDVEPPAPPPRAKRRRGQASAGHGE